MIYLDHAATNPINPRIYQVLVEDLQDLWGNASTMYDIGMESKRILEASRAKIAQCLGVEADEIYFTSGASEGNSWVLNQRNKCLCSPYEHDSILLNPKSCIIDDDYLNMATIGALEDDILSIARISSFENFLLSWQLVNSETGEIFNLNKYSHYAHELGMVFHTDITQAVGNVKLDLKGWGVDCATMSGHKIGAPKNIGIVYFNKDVFPPEKIKPLIYGHQEKGVRGGTENVPFCHALALAVDEAVATQENKSAYCKTLKKAFYDELMEDNFANEFVYIVSPANSVNSTINICFKDVESEVLQMLMNQDGFSVATGSACSTGTMEPSKTLEYMKVPEDYIRGEIRLTFDESNDRIDLVLAAQKLKQHYLELISNG